MPDSSTGMGKGFSFLFSKVAQYYARLGEKGTGRCGALCARKRPAKITVEQAHAAYPGQ